MSNLVDNSGFTPLLQACETIASSPPNKVSLEVSLSGLWIFERNCPFTNTNNTTPNWTINVSTRHLGDANQLSTYYLTLSLTFQAVATAVISTNNSSFQDLESHPDDLFLVKSWNCFRRRAVRACCDKINFKITLLWVSCNSEMVKEMASAIWYIPYILS